MKKAVLTAMIILTGLCSFAQETDNPEIQKGEKAPRKETEKHKINRPLRCPRVYVTLSMGLNNNTGFPGLSVDVPVARFFSVDGGAGISTWGTKIGVSGRYYLQPCHRGWAFGGGVTYNTGMKNTTQNLATVTGSTEEVGLDMHPQTNVFLAAYRFWNLGKAYNRLYLELGYSAPLNPVNRFNQTSGDEITSTSTGIVNLLSPGGLIIGLGFSFGVY